MADFKQQQQDRVEEGKELQREDEMRDLSQIPSKELPGGKSLLTKVSESISNVANAISEKVGLSEPVVEGHEDLDKGVRKQVKKINQEILKQVNANKLPEVENQWETGSLPKQVRKEIEEAAGKVPAQKPEKPADKTSIAGKVREGVQGLSGSISQGVGSLKQKFTKENNENTVDDGTKHYKTVKDGFKESVDELKHEQRIAELGQEELTSKNPFQPLTSGNKDEDENRTLGEKVKGGLNDASQKISSTVGGVTQKVKSAFVHKEANPQDKENAQQIA